MNNPATFSLDWDALHNQNKNHLLSLLEGFPSQGEEAIAIGENSEIQRALSTIQTIDILKKSLSKGSG
ncbi:MAG: hypothetical protein GXO76_04105 [Calditrichaeota bacterium]|nr:hypothetical protein [Calditrichota bacterium]